MSIKNHKTNSNIRKVVHVMSSNNVDEYQEEPAFVDLIMDLPLHKVSSFPLRISAVNVTKSAVSCGFGHIY